MISKQFLSYAETPAFKAELMDLALVGDAVILMDIRKVGYDRLRFYSSAVHSDFDGRYKSNETMIKFCKQHKLFVGQVGKYIADHLEAYIGWCFVNKHNDLLRSFLDQYFLWYMTRNNDKRVSISCPLLRQRFPLLFV